MAAKVTAGLWFKPSNYFCSPIYLFFSLVGTPVFMLFCLDLEEIERHTRRLCRELCGEYFFPKGVTLIYIKVRAACVCFHMLEIPSKILTLLYTFKVMPENIYMYIGIFLG